MFMLVYTPNNFKNTVQLLRKELQSLSTLSKMPVRCFLMFSLLFKVPFFVDADCSKGNCQTYALDFYGDAVENSELVGHVFHQSSTVNTIPHCHSRCVDDCRCLSFNYKENHGGKVCELNSRSHFTNPNSLKHSPGSRYYNLRREQTKKVRPTKL